MVKASLMLKINGDLLSYDTTKVVDLGKEWRNSNPIRAESKTITAIKSEDGADNEDGGVGNNGNYGDNNDGSSS
jgi:hypothetical protein